jgi:hypothetical protein
LRRAQGPDALKEHRTLVDAELEAVSGGIVVTKHSDVSTWRAPRLVSDGTSNTLFIGE